MLIRIRKVIGSSKAIRKSVNVVHTYRDVQKAKNHQKVVTKHIWENYIDEAEHIRHSPIGKESYSLHSQTIERVFADAKEKYGMRYTLYRGLTKVATWVRLKFACMNLKKLAMWAWKSPHLFQYFMKNMINHLYLLEFTEKPYFV